VDVALQAIRYNILSVEGIMDVVNVCSAHRAYVTVHEIVECFIAQFVLVQKGKASGGKIGVTGGCPITVTLIRHLFLFRDESPGETSPVTWGFEKAKVKVSRKIYPLSQVTLIRKSQRF
jgi:hypothetical protein